MQKKKKKIEIWCQKYIIWIFSDKILKKTIVIFEIIEISTLEFVKVKKIHVKPNKFKFRTINTNYLGTFRLQSWS